MSRGRRTAALTAGATVGVLAVAAVALHHPAPVSSGTAAPPVATPTRTTTTTTAAAPTNELRHVTEAGGTAVNLTIDDGPSPTYTPQVLALLEQYHATATFCLLGPAAKANPGLVKQIVAGGHRLCDHTVHHDTAMDHKSQGYQKQEILDGLRMITEASGGAPVQYYRAPGGAFTPYSRDLAAAHGMQPLGWNVDSEDFKRPGAGAILNTVESEHRDDQTILVHDGGGNREQTVSALRLLLPWLIQNHHPLSFPKIGAAR